MHHLGLGGLHWPGPGRLLQGLGPDGWTGRLLCGEYMLLARNFGCLVAITRATPAARIRNKSIRKRKRGLMKILIMVLTITFREGYEIHREGESESMGFIYMDFQCCQGILCSLLSKKKKKNREAFTDTPNCAVKSYINSKKKCRLFLKKGTLGSLSLSLWLSFSTSPPAFSLSLWLSFSTSPFFLSLWLSLCTTPSAFSLWFFYYSFLRLSLVGSLFDCHFLLLLLLSLFDFIVTF